MSALTEFRNAEAVRLRRLALRDLLTEAAKVAGPTALANELSRRAEEDTDEPDPFRCFTHHHVLGMRGREVRTPTEEAKRPNMEAMPALPPTMEFRPIDHDVDGEHTRTGYNVWQVLPDGDKSFVCNSVYPKDLAEQAAVCWAKWGVSQETWEQMCAAQADLSEALATAERLQKGRDDWSATASRLQKAWEESDAKRAAEAERLTAERDEAFRRHSNLAQDVVVPLTAERDEALATVARLTKQLEESAEDSGLKSLMLTAAEGEVVRLTAALEFIREHSEDERVRDTCSLALLPQETENG